MGRGAEGGLQPLHVGEPGGHTQGALLEPEPNLDFHQLEAGWEVPPHDSLKYLPRGDFACTVWVWQSFLEWMMGCLSWSQLQAQ